MLSQFLRALACVLVMPFLVSCGGADHRAPAPAAARADGGQRITGPYTHDNLAVYFIHGPETLPTKTYLTLDEAIAAKKVTVHETGDVNELAIENVSADDVYIQSGDIVKGGQQDRTMASDFVLAPRSGKVPINAFCVESGRWTQRGQEHADYFASAHTCVPSKGLKLALRSEGQQQSVWANVARVQEKLSANAAGSVAATTSPSSLQLTLENKVVQDTTEDYVKELEPLVDSKKDVIGYAFAINGKMNSADVYASHALFKKLWPRLIRASSVEAFSEMEKGKSYAAPAKEQVRACLENPKAAPKKQQVNARTETAAYDANDSILLDTSDDGALIHRNYITKEPEAQQSPAPQIQQRNDAAPSQPPRR